MRILVVEDDRDLSRQLGAALTEANYAVDFAYDGEEGHYLGEGEPYDAIILDLGLPTIDGVTVLKRWRDAGLNMPVLILTARDGWSEKVAGFDAGADDYVTKPFRVEEVLAQRNVEGRGAAFAKLKSLRITNKLIFIHAGLEGKSTILLSGADRIRLSMDLGRFGFHHHIINTSGGRSESSFKPSEELTGKYLEQSRQ